MLYHSAHYYFFIHLVSFFLSVGFLGDNDDLSTYLNIKCRENIV